MSIADARAALHALAALEVDLELPDQLAAEGVDAATVGEVASAVELAEAALIAQAAAAEAQARADAATADPNDDGAAAAAQAVADDAIATAAALAAEAMEAAHGARCSLDRRHGGMEAAVAEAGGSGSVATVAWYDR